IFLTTQNTDYSEHNAAALHASGIQAIYTQYNNASAYAMLLTNKDTVPNLYFENQGN
uniref:Dextransucrase (Fragments) n=1 Tax=Leuconostoc mesenteroides TaxID=1245 RepID=Q7M0M1_LEUME